jgi:hypothetical protein
MSAEMVTDEIGVEIHATGWYVVRSFHDAVMVIKCQRGKRVPIQEILDGAFSNHRDAREAAAAIRR